MIVCVNYLQQPALDRRTFYSCVLLPPCCGGLGDFVYPSPDRPPLPLVSTSIIPGMQELQLTTNVTGGTRGWFARPPNARYFWFAGCAELPHVVNRLLRGIVLRLHTECTWEYKR